MTARDQLLARFRDEAAGPPTGSELALRYSRHGRFQLWVSPPLPEVTVACSPECDTDELRVSPGELGVPRVSDRPPWTTGQAGQRS